MFYGDGSRRQPNPRSSARLISRSRQSRKGGQNGVCQRVGSKGELRQAAATTVLGSLVTFLLSRSTELLAHTSGRAGAVRRKSQVKHHSVSCSGKRKGSRRGEQSVSFHAKRIADRNFAIAVCRGRRITTPRSDDTCEARADVSSSAT